MPSTRERIALIVGTRPEAIKIAPIFRALQKRGASENLVVATGQHADLLDHTLGSLHIVPSVTLNVMRPGQAPSEVLSRVIDACTNVFKEVRPSSVVVQGDTTTVLAAALAAFHLRVPVAHVEAGLRTYDENHPFPEEANRQMVDRLSRWCFAPTALARENLLAERIAPDRIYVTGNTAVDNLLWMSERVGEPSTDPFVLVTLHRRESFGASLDEILLGVADFLRECPDSHVIWPVHPNPSVKHAATKILGGNARVQLRDPLPYREFVQLLRGARLILTDSGGLQEEAPSLGKTVLVAREVTERPEALETGQNRLVGRKRSRVRDGLLHAWAEPAYTGPLPAPNPFGDGRAAQRVVDVLLSGKDESHV